MYRYIYGFDTAHPAQCAQELRRKGIHAVVTGNADTPTVDALADEGIDLYLCCGAYGIRDASDPLAQDASGETRKWFGSGCPNNRAVIQAHIDVILERASRLPTVKGIFIDGARFASFASTEGPESFFTCFCPRCMEKMGANAETIRSAVLRLQQNRRIQDGDGPALQAWFAFREQCVREAFDAFSEQVHALNASLRASAFVFAPSLGRFVGQTPSAFRSLDIVAPMLYRAYPHTEGPACLGHEWSALTGLFGAHAESFAALAAPASLTPALAPWKEQMQALLDTGFGPEQVGAETAQAHANLHPGQKLWPIVQIEDPHIDETLRLVYENGADAAGYFMYGQAELPEPRN